MLSAAGNTYDDTDTPPACTDRLRATHDRTRRTQTHLPEHDRIRAGLPERGIAGRLYTAHARDQGAQVNSGRYLTF